MMVKRTGALMIVACFVLSAVVVVAPAVSGAAEPTQIKAVRYDADARGIVVELSRKLPYQLIQVDDRELLLALKSVDMEKDLPGVDNDPLLASISRDRLPGNIVGLMIHTRKNVTHESTEWDESSGHVLVRLK